MDALVLDALGASLSMRLECLRSVCLLRRATDLPLADRHRPAWCDRRRHPRAGDAHQVRFLRLQFTDILGVIKNVEIPASQFRKALKGDILFDGSSIQGFVRVEESDMLLAPDVSTFQIFPWGDPAARVARLICDVNHPDGRPFAGDPRQVLKRQVVRAAEQGFTMNAGMEAEFFLFKVAPDGTPSTATHDVGSYFDLAPMDLRRRSATRDRRCAGTARLRSRGRPSRSRARPARDRFPLRRRAPHRRQHRDLPLRREAGGAPVRLVRVVHAQAGVRAERQRHAHASVVVPPWPECVLGPAG
jgi:hypothetical protein